LEVINKTSDKILVTKLYYFKGITYLGRRIHRETNITRPLLYHLPLPVPVVHYNFCEHQLMKHTAKETKVRRPTTTHTYMYTKTNCTLTDRARYPRVYSFGKARLCFDKTRSYNLIVTLRFTNIDENTYPGESPAVAGVQYSFSSNMIRMYTVNYCPMQKKKKLFSTECSANIRELHLKGL
jgi:hypothetical protein